MVGTKRLGRPVAPSRVKTTVSGPPGVDLVNVVAGSSAPDATLGAKTTTPGAFEGIVFPACGSNSVFLPKHMGAEHALATPSEATSVPVRTARKMKEAGLSGFMSTGIAAVVPPEISENTIVWRHAVCHPCQLATRSAAAETTAGFAHGTGPKVPAFPRGADVAADRVSLVPHPRWQHLPLAS